MCMLKAYPVAYSPLLNVIESGAVSSETVSIRWIQVDQGGVLLAHWDSSKVACVECGSLQHGTPLVNEGRRNDLIEALMIEQTCWGAVQAV